MSLHQQVKQTLLSSLNVDKQNEMEQLNNSLRLLSKWRSVLIQNTVLQNEGTKVVQGPLKGLDFIEQSAEGCHTAKLLGCYEQPLLPYIEKSIQANYKTILNIGCAEGYYAVGMAMKMPNTKVIAHDVNENAQLTCKALAEKNKVTDRIEVGALFQPEDFEKYPSNTLVLCDIEGAEDELLNLQIAPALSLMDIIVESHDALIPGMTDKLIKRFENTHDIKVIHDDGMRNLENMPDWFNQLAHLDQLLAVWEWRSGPTPWLIMTAKNKKK